VRISMTELAGRRSRPNLRVISVVLAGGRLKQTESGLTNCSDWGGFPDLNLERLFIQTRNWAYWKGLRASLVSSSNKNNTMLAGFSRNAQAQKSLDRLVHVDISGRPTVTKPPPIARIGVAAKAIPLQRGVMPDLPEFGG
jgi:hypothetical protein